MQVTRHRIWNSITVITTAAAIAGICSLSPVSASDGDKAPAPQASTPAPVAAPTEAAAGNASDVPETNQPQPPKPGLTEEQILQRQPMTGIPVDVPVPRKVIFMNS